MDDNCGEWVESMGVDSGLVSCPRPQYARTEGLVTSCTTSCSKVWNVARPIRSLGL